MTTILERQGALPHAPEQKSAFLRLPAELRNHIYDFFLINDIEAFAETACTPALLSVNEQLREEYAGLFYSSNLIKVDAYYTETDSWCEVQGRYEKQALLENSTYADLFDFWSLASARRYCQRPCYNRESARRGILTVSTPTGFRRWQWTCFQD
ncbi:hypothetical protein Tdes44962_MAKER01700 [Teratosphaeria destructans]|uniref:Uncharacterized protein n=1 Tax=Teratosphaeria destructans TaxID=418781 RepID=A0A9W7W578_9PEZI|nr:hypothetical protein Tdes44962_MAKER01700 [Teratosphaeria destructans]